MVFEEKSKGLIIKRYPNGVERHVYLDRERAYELSKIKTVYENEVLKKKISHNKLVKIAIDILIESIENKSEEEAINYLKEHHKKAFF